VDSEVDDEDGDDVGNLDEDGVTLPARSSLMYNAWKQSFYNQIK